MASGVDSDHACALSTIFDRTEIQHIRNRVVWLKKVEKAYLGQLTKNKYILNQDTNSKYFYALVKKNKKRNHITHLMTDDGATTSEGEVAERFVHYFESLLGVVSPGNGVVNGVLDLGWLIISRSGLPTVCCMQGN
ncbi:hypothetical protein ACS0TY_026100 [Phlomoides rotata]